MTLFHVKWSVRAMINVPGQHDDGVRDGDISIVASGEVDTESAQDLRDALTAELEKVFPRHDLGPTYDIDRLYEIEITEV